MTERHFCSRLQRKVIRHGKDPSATPPLRGVSNGARHGTGQMSLHDWLGTHAPDLKTSHWEGGHFVTRCTVCGKMMVKLPGLPWKLKAKRV